MSVQMLASELVWRGAELSNLPSRGVNRLTERIPILDE